jgi:hypothetical protein
MPVEESITPEPEMISYNVEMFGGHSCGRGSRGRPSRASRQTSHATRSKPMFKKNISTIYYFHSLLVVLLNDAELRNLIQSCTFSVFITVQYSVPITHLTIQ